MMSAYDVLDTPIGWIGMLATDSGLARTTLPKASREECADALNADDGRAHHDPERFTAIADRLLAYFAGAPVSFEDVRVDVEDASRFHRAAWEGCRSIPFGETRNYKWVAAQAGRPGAARAAGQSMARNRLPIIIPCHRVIGSDGRLVGYGRGSSMLRLKRWLLDLERSAVAA